MASNILSIGQSALAAAQVGLSTTGHNIANASTPGYNRQIVIQGSAIAQNFGFGFLGQGTEINDIRRIYSSYLGTQVNNAQSANSQLSTYYKQITQIDNVLADPTAGLSPALQGFFSGVQGLSAHPDDAASRQAVLSSAEALASRFQSLQGRIDEIGQGVNSQIAASVTSINSYAQRISALNDSIDRAQSVTDGKGANDLLDQRDQLVAELSKEVGVSVVEQGTRYSIFIGNGQPLVLGVQTFNLKALQSPTDPSRIDVGYTVGGTTVAFNEREISSGKLGGLLEFRSTTLDTAQNSLGRVAIGLAATFNDQHRLGQDQNGVLGTNFFSSATITPSSSANNTGTAVLNAAITDPNLLTTSDYQIKYDGTNYILSRVPSNTQLSATTLAAAQTAATSEGFSFSIASGTPAAGDTFKIRPTATGASGFSVALTDIANIATAAPIRSSAATANLGTGKITAGSVNTPPPPNANLQQPIKITFTSATTFDVTGTGTGLPATGVSYTPGADITYNGWTVQISGAPTANDTFSIDPNTNGKGDSRNVLALGKLQSANTLANGTTSYQGAYAQLVSLVGNKAHEMDVTSSAAEKLYAQAYQAQQSESGVNLDEEAANLLRYQQAYQAAGKVMQMASQLFDVLLSIGN